MGCLKNVYCLSRVSGEAKVVALQRQLDSIRTENLHLDSERDELKLKVGLLALLFIAEYIAAF